MKKHKCHTDDPTVCKMLKKNKTPSPIPCACDNYLKDYMCESHWKNFQLFPRLVEALESQHQAYSFPDCAWDEKWHKEHNPKCSICALLKEARGVGK